MFTNSKSLFQKFTKNCYVWRKETCYKSSFFYSLNFFSLEFHLSLFYLFWCLLFFCSYSWSYWRNFSCYFFCLVNLVTFLFVFLLKKNHRNFCFSIFSSKRKKEKKQWIFFSHFFSWYQAASCVLTIFFSLFVRLFVCLVCCNPGKTITTTKLKRERKRKRKQKSYDTSVTTLCSALLSLYSR